MRQGAVVDHNSAVDSGMEIGVSILRLVNLRKVREQGDVRFDLHIPTFDLHAGQFVAVVGDSGCGKYPSRHAGTGLETEPL